MTNDQKFGERRAASFQNPESTIQNLESSDAVEGYRERAVAIRIFTERIGLQVIPIGRSCPVAPGGFRHRCLNSGDCGCRVTGAFSRITRIRRRYIAQGGIGGRGRTTDNHWPRIPGNSLPRFSLRSRTFQIFRVHAPSFRERWIMHLKPVLHEQSLVKIHNFPTVSPTNYGSSHPRTLPSPSSSHNCLMRMRAPAANTAITLESGWGWYPGLVGSNSSGGMR